MTSLSLLAGRTSLSISVYLLWAIPWRRGLMAGRGLWISVIFLYNSNTTISYHNSKLSYFSYQLDLKVLEIIHPHPLSFSSKYQLLERNNIWISAISYSPPLTLCLLALSADNLCNQIGPTKRLACSGLLWVQTVWHYVGLHQLYFQISWFKKNQQTIKSRQIYQECKDLRCLISF